MENPGVRVTQDSSPFTIVNRRSPEKNPEQARKEQLREVRVAQQKAQLAEETAKHGTALEITRGSKRRNFAEQKAPIERNLLKEKLKDKFESDAEPIRTITIAEDTQNCQKPNAAG